MQRIANFFKKLRPSYDEEEEDDSLATSLEKQAVDETKKVHPNWTSVTNNLQSSAELYEKHGKYDNELDCLMMLYCLLWKNKAFHDNQESLLFSKIMSICTEHFKLREMGKKFQKFATKCEFDNNTEDAIRLYRMAIDNMDPSDNTATVIKLHMNVGNLLARHPRLDISHVLGAKEHYMAALKLSETSNVGKYGFAEKVFFIQICMIYLDLYSFQSVREETWIEMNELEQSYPAVSFSNEKKLFSSLEGPLKMLDGQAVYHAIEQHKNNINGPVKSLLNNLSVMLNITYLKNANHKQDPDHVNDHFGDGPNDY